MNWQPIFDFGATLLYLILGWLMRMLWDSIRDHGRDIEAQRKAAAEFQQHVSDTYVRNAWGVELKNDMRVMQEAIFRKLDRIEEKIDGKMDKVR